MTRIILVRHGQTQWNVEERFRGSFDIPLDETGIAQAQALARRLSAEPVSAVYSSPLQRALKTAEIISQPHSLTPIVHQGLNNINYGELEGRKISEVARELPEFFQKLMATPHLVRFPGGDTLDDLTVRSMAALHEIIAAHPRETVVVTSHQVITRVLICAIIGLDNSYHWMFSQDTCCANFFRFQKGRFIVDRLNDVCHLGDSAGMPPDE